MDGSLITRQEKLLQRLAARTDRSGVPRKGYKENVAAIRAELARYQEGSVGQAES